MNQKNRIEWWRRYIEGDAFTRHELIENNPMMGKNLIDMVVMFHEEDKEMVLFNIHTLFQSYFDDLIAEMHMLNEEGDEQ
jgi:hypothetical protein